MAADKQRGKQSVRDMVISLAVIVLAAWVIYIFVPHDDGEDPVKPVSYQVELQSAQRAAPYPVAAPKGLSKEWRATSVTYEADGPQGSAWHLGFMAPGNEYAAVEQSDDKPADTYVGKVTQGAKKTDKTMRVGDEEWQRWEGEKYDALVRVAPEEESGAATTVVTGTASFQQLARLAEALEEGGEAKTGGEAKPEEAAKS
ncbi:DUF4245 domain-containing protein [Streptomyces sp. HNM0574]|uniref:DUF4245 domain-containing protein n=1 Tax=Streptomyces sp. HNM0574 TaxID=2714954 RepID=UPI0032177860